MFKTIKTIAIIAAAVLLTACGGGEPEVMVCQPDNVGEAECLKRGAGFPFQFSSESESMIFSDTSDVQWIQEQTGEINVIRVTRK